MIFLFNNDGVKFLEQFDDETIDCIITDPPYGILGKRCKIETDFDLNFFFEQCYRVLKKDAFMLYFGQQPTLSFWNVIALQYFSYKNEVIWYKRQSSSPMFDMSRMFENIFIVQKGKRQFNDVKRKYTDVKESLADFVEKETVLRGLDFFRSLVGSKERMQKILDDDRYKAEDTARNYYANIQSKVKKQNSVISGYKSLAGGIKPQNIVSFMPHNKKRFEDDDYNIKHPTVKPLDLMEYLIELMTDKYDFVLDPFMGSGSTGIACKYMNRNFIGNEIHSDFYEIAKERIAKVLI